MKILRRKSEIANGEWLPDMDLNHDKQIQSLLCYRYTIGQTDALERLKSFMSQSSHQTSAEQQGTHLHTTGTQPSGCRGVSIAASCSVNAAIFFAELRMLVLSLRDKGKRRSHIVNRKS